ncbi:MAG: prepilin-type N-terminal cleavage/methylation domain-containing protein [Rhodanobacteraceae bacterium]
MSKSGFHPACAQRACGAMRGFTLIELLVVVAIIGVVALALTLSIGGSEERRLTREAERFQLVVAQACAHAELTGREIGIVVGTGGFSFRLLTGTEWQDAYAEGELRPRQWIEGLRAELSREGRIVDLSNAREDTPQLVCFSSGELTPFALTLALGDAPRYRVTGADDSTLKVARVDTSP